MASKDAQFRDRFFDSRYKVEKTNKTSAEKLNELKAKLESSFKSPKNNIDTSWKAFRSEIRTQSTTSFTMPSFSHYQDISNFRPTTPNKSSILSQPGRIRHQTELFKQFSPSRTPSPLIQSPSANKLIFSANKRKIQETVTQDDLRKALEILEEMNEMDCSQMSAGYKQTLIKFCNQVLSKLRSRGF
ncbi:unnamed protein product [Blepharisma stoltei]|uniref:Uncharacterized protein n=1 Tax=Blepharisma stoltei TaxID=1481888 RepID=A0AAU9K416_9CILI|nr:unnamed protein product [Blepharisma stoltei]